MHPNIDVENDDQPRDFGAGTGIADKPMIYGPVQIYTVFFDETSRNSPGLCQYGMDSNSIAMFG